MTVDTSLSLIERQAELEATAFSEGAARFRSRLQKAQDKGAASTFGAGKSLLLHALDDVQVAIQTMIDAKGKRGPRHVATAWCKAVGADVAAFMALKVILDGIAKKRTLRSVALNIGTLILDELRFRRFKEQAPQLFEYKLKSFHTTSYVHRAKSLQASMRFADIDCSDLDLPPERKALIGMKLVGLVIESTGIVALYHETTSKKRRGSIRQETYVVATEETQEWLKTRNEHIEFFQPVVLPMVVPPLDWSAEQRGGYWHHLQGKFPLIRGMSKEQEAKLREADLSQVYKALNLIQRTQWKINRPVLDLVTRILDLGGGVGGLPTMDDEPLPAKPQDIATNKESRRAWRKAAGAVRNRNAGRRQRGLDAIKLIAAAQAVADEAAIYFPYSLDFRGRIYPIISYLTPQGDDLSRSLLTFAHGKPVDEAAARWLAIHGANCLGETPEGRKVSRMTMDERFEWIVSNSERLIQVALRPLDDLWWSKADKPLQFFAFCVEWAGLLEANDRGEEYVCSLPCNMDGSCNGLQHFSALLRDAVGGRAVNLVPQHTPQDIYDRVATVVLDGLQAEAEQDNQLAKLWLGLHQTTGIVNRKLCKRPTMTFGYGSKRFGFKQQLLEYLGGLDDFAAIKAHFTVLNENNVPSPKLTQACALMADLIWRALGQAAVAAFDGMAWMQQAARGAVKGGRSVYWTVPGTNFPVIQRYFAYERRIVKTIMNGSVVKASVWNETSQINTRKQANAIAPNYIHSLDAACLMLTVTAAAAEGVEHFAMIHDSYGTLPADCTVMARCCRQAFVWFYTRFDVIGEFHRQLAAAHADPAECPAPPTPGDLDVSQVMLSEYFFA